MTLKFTAKRAVYGAAMLAVLVGMAWFMATRGPLATPRVEIAAAAVKDLRPAVFGVGTVEARYAYAVGPTQAGRVLRLLADQGDRVKAGQLLAEIDPVDLDARVRASAMSAQRARAALAAAAAQAREAASRSKTEQASAARFRQLAAQGFVSAEALDARQNEADAANAAHDAALASLEAARRELDKAAAEQEGLAKQRANLKLLSPVDGVVTAREAEAGSTVVAGQAVLRLIDPASLWVRARIDQARAGEITAGQPAQITLRSHPGEPLAGRVARVELQSDSVAEERLVQVSFGRIPPDVSVGELAEVTIQLPAAKSAVSVASSAVKAVDGRTGVWRIAGGKADFVPVRVGIATLEGESQIVQGLNPGDEVIVHSPVALSQGLKVRGMRVRK